MRFRWPRCRKERFGMPPGQLAKHPANQERDWRQKGSQNQPPEECPGKSTRRSRKIPKPRRWMLLIPAGGKNYAGKWCCADKGHGEHDCCFPRSEKRRVG